MTDDARMIAAAAAVGAWGLLVAWTAWRHRPRKIASGSDAVLVAYASQTGAASGLAQATADALKASGRNVTLLSFARLTPQMLAQTKEALFVASTTGEGDPPDDASTFLQQFATRAPQLDGLRYALLALGDSHYKHFCGFGRALDQLLRDAGASMAAERIEMDQGDAEALGRWQQTLRLFGASDALPDWEAPRYAHWTLAGRELLNAGSPGEALYRISLKPDDATQDWRAGDIAEVYPGPADEAFADAPHLQHRDYSLASIGSEGAADLVVRVHRDANGRIGLGSGWLCERVNVGDAIAMRIRANPRFATPDAAMPAILIGNGSGISALRAHLMARGANTRNWLIYGERDPACDRPYARELDQWAASGHLQRLDRVFSRGESQIRYVQHAVTANADALRNWVNEGAAILVCGSIAMGSDVDAALRDALGPEAMSRLVADERYQRDIY